MRGFFEKKIQIVYFSTVRIFDTYVVFISGDVLINCFTFYSVNVKYKKQRILYLRNALVFHISFY